MKTMRKWMFAPLALLLVFVMTMPITANTRLADNAGILTYEQQIQLNDRLETISRNRNNTVAIVTVPRLEGTRDAVRAADQMYDRMNFGNNGIMLFITNEAGNREWQIVTRGFSETAFTNRGLRHIERQILPYLREDNFYAAFNLFASLADEFLIDARAGNVRHNSGYTPMVAIVCVAIAVAIGLAVVFGMKSGHRSAKPQRAACNYVRAGSFNLTTQRDLFLFRRVTRVARAQSSGGGSGRGGRVGGGRGGRF